MSTTWPSGKKKTFWPLIEELVDKGQLVPDSRLKFCMDMLVTLLTLLVFVVGFGCLFAYSVGVNQRSQMNFLDTSFPVLLHITGVGTSVLLKVRATEKKKDQWVVISFKVARLHPSCFSLKFSCCYSTVLFILLLLLFWP
jgi:hypothetical protein